MKCDVECCGFTCDKDMGHGQIHRHPSNPAKGRECTYWTIWPYNTEEYNDVTGKPWTGYQLVFDSQLD